MEIILTIGVGMVINLIFLLYIRSSANKSKSKPKYTGELTNIIENMTFAKPDNIRVFLDDEPKDEILDQDIIPLIETDEQGAPLVLLKPREILTRKPYYGKPIVANKYIDTLHDYMIDCGIAVEKNTLREMFAGLATSKLIIIKHEKREIAHRVVELFTDFTGLTMTFDDINKDTHDFDDMFQEDYHFKNALFAADQKKHLMHCYLMNQVNMDDFVYFSIESSILHIIH